MPSTPKDSPTLRRRLVALGLTSAVVGSSAPVPLYPIYRAELGLDTFSMTLIFVVYVVAVLGALLTSGKVMARLDSPHRLLAPALLVVAAGALIMSQAHSLAWLLAGRTLAGLGTGCATVAANAALVELAPRRDVRHAALVSTLCFGAGSAIGPFLAGAALQLDLWPTVLPFVLIAAVALVSAWSSVQCLRSPALRTGGQPADGQDGQAASSGPGVAAVQWFPFALCAGTVLATWGFGATLMALGPYFGHVLLGIDNYAITGYATALFTVAGTTSQWLHRRTPARRAFLRGTAIVTLGVVLMVTAMALGAPELAAASLALTSIGHGAAFGAAAGLVNQLAPPDQRSRLVSLFYVAGYVGNLIPMLLWAVTDRFGAMAAAMGFLLAFGLAIAGIGLSARRGFRGV